MSTPLDSLGRQIKVGSLIAKAMSNGGSSVKIQIYRVLEIIEIPRTRYRFTEELDENGRRVRVGEPWTDHHLKAQAVSGSGYGGIPTKPSKLEALHSLLVLPPNFLDEE